MTVRPATRRPVCADSETLLATCTSRMADKLRLSTTDSNTHAAKSSLCSMPTTCGCQRNLRAFREAFERHHSAGMAYHRMYWWDGANEIEARSEEHTSELQSRRDLVCRLLLEKKKKNQA